MLPVQIRQLLLLHKQKGKPGERRMSSQRALHCPGRPVLGDDLSERMHG